jgi:membrane-associated phospholipid phosphatase
VGAAARSRRSSTTGVAGARTISAVRHDAEPDRDLLARGYRRAIRSLASLRLELALAAAYALGAVLVAVGAFDGIDGFAVAHLMPGVGGDRSKPSFVESLVPFLHQARLHQPAVARVAHAVTSPASVVPSLLLLAGACVALRRRGAGAEAAVWIAAWIAVGATELLCKSVLRRPALYAVSGGERVHLDAFDMSYPSGHTLRALLLAAIVARLWPRLWPLSVAGALAVIAALELGGAHVPSDLLGGVVLAALAVASVRHAAQRVDAAVR